MEEIPFYEDNIFWIILAIVAAIYLVIWLVKRYAAGRRRDAMQQRANEKMLGFSAEDEQLTELAKSYTLGSQGRKHKAMNVLSGNENGVDFQLFDFYYRTGYGRYTKHHNISTIRFNSNRLSTPEFEIRKRVTLDKLSSSIRKAAKVEMNHEAFDKKYRVLASSEHEIELVRDMMSNKVSELAPGEIYNIEVRNGQMLVYRPGKRMKLAQLDDFQREARERFNMFSTSSDWG